MDNRNNKVAKDKNNKRRACELTDMVFKALMENRNKRVDCFLKRKK